MKEKIIYLIIGLISISGFTQTNNSIKLNQSDLIKIKNQNDSIISINIEQFEIIKNLRKEFGDYKKEINSKVEYQNQTLTLSTNSTSTALTALNNYLALWGIIFAIFGILIGAYIIWVQSRVTNILKDAQDVLAQQKVIQKEVNNTQELIESDLTGLYLKLENQEIKIMLDRLKRNPEDLVNLFKRLATKELSKEHYCSLKEIGLLCYSSENAGLVSQRIDITTLLIQHYPEKVLFDNEINHSVFPILKTSINNLFSIEIIHSTVCVINYVVNRNLQDFKEGLNQFFKSIKESDKFELEDIYSNAYDTCLSKKSKFKLFELIESNEKFRKVFGVILLNEFENGNNSDEQNIIIEGIKESNKNNKSS